VSLSQRLLCPLVQFGALAHQPGLPYAQIEEVLLKTASPTERNTA